VEEEEEEDEEDSSPLAYRQLHEVMQEREGGAERRNAEKAGTSGRQKQTQDEDPPLWPTAVVASLQNKNHSLLSPLSSPSPSPTLSHAAHPSSCLLTDPCLTHCVFILASPLLPPTHHPPTLRLFLCSPSIPSVRG
jgi:hypothetical protein